MHFFPVTCRLETIECVELGLKHCNMTYCNKATAQNPTPALFGEGSNTMIIQQGTWTCPRLKAVLTSQFDSVLGH